MTLRSILILFAIAACQTSAPPRATDASRAQAPTLAIVGVYASSGERHLVKAELARTNDERQRGLMHRRALGADEGMLFIFDHDDRHTFWMHDTLLPLDMVFIRSDGLIAGIVPRAEPMTDTSRSIPAPSRYVLEVVGGWCESHGIVAGDRIDLDEALRTAGGDSSVR